MTDAALTHPPTHPPIHTHRRGGSGGAVLGGWVGFLRWARLSVLEEEEEEGGGAAMVSLGNRSGGCGARSALLCGGVGGWVVVWVGGGVGDWMHDG